MILLREKVVEYKEKVVVLESERDELLASKTSLQQQNTSCIEDDLAGTMSELSLNYEVVKSLKGILT